MKTGRNIAAILALSAFVAGQTPPASGPKATAPAKASQKPAAHSAPTKAPANPAETPAAAPAAGAAQLAPGDVVVSITGICAPKAKTAPAQSAPCDMKITRAEFEKVIEAISANPSEIDRGNLANIYSQLMAMAAEAEKLGLDKDPLFQERLRLERLKQLAQSAENKLRAESVPAAAEIDTFYTENSSKFEEVAIRRISVPKIVEKVVKEAEAKALAEKIRERAAAGEDTDKLQAEVNDALKVPGAPPSTSQGWKRRGSMDQRHEAQVAALSAGQVSQLLEDPQTIYIYKVDSKRLIPLETVRADIERYLQNRHLAEKIQQVLSGVKTDLNDAYFGKPEPQLPVSERPNPHQQEQKQ